MKCKYLLLPALALAFSASAQQTVMGWSLTDMCRVTDANMADDKVAAVCDRDDMSALTVDNFPGLYSIYFTSSEELNVRGVNLVAADDVEQAPSRATLYAYDEAASDWVVIARLNTISFASPYTSWQGNTLASRTAAFKRFRLDIQKVKKGNTLKIAEVQLLGFRDKVASNLATEAAGAFSAPEGVAENLWALSGNDMGEALKLRNVKSEYGLENAWIDYEFNIPTPVSAYSLTMPPASVSQNYPRTWELLASNDGVTWSTLDMRNNEGFMGVSNVSTLYSIPTSGAKIDFAAVADELYKVADQKFLRNWGAGKYLIHAWNEDPELLNDGYNYWWMAHAVDAYLDAYLRTGDNTYMTRAEQIKRGMYTAYDAGRQDLWNSFYDDMEWMCLACLRAYENGVRKKSEWLAEAKQLYEWIWGGWTDVKGGGISWNTGSGKDSKNACANAPAIICAAKLYKITGEERYLENAVKIFEWMKQYCLFEDGFVKDGCENEIRSWAFTYNQGTWVGGLMHLYEITKDRKYYDIAVDLMDKSINDRWYSPDGIMREQGSSDGGLFKGIYVRYIADWVRSGLLDEEHRYRYAKYLVENARSMYISSLLKPDFTVMPCWKSRASVFNGENNGGEKGSYHASILLSGIFLCEAVDAMRRDGILDDSYAVVNTRASLPYKKYRLLITSNNGGDDVQISKFTLEGESGSAVASPSTDAAEVMKALACEGGISVVSAEEGLHVDLYDIAGKHVASAATPCTLLCDSGLYIVKSAASVAKVMVK